LFWLLLCCFFFQKAIENKPIKDYISFKDGCPYAAQLGDDPSMKEFLKCPKFQNKNCPFKNATTMRELCEEMSKISVDTPDHQLALQVVFKAIHAASKSVEAEMGNCPAFKTSASCPFKSVKSNGRPLVEPPETALCGDSVEAIHPFCFTEWKPKCMLPLLLFFKLIGSDV